MFDPCNVVQVHPALSGGTLRRGEKHPISGIGKGPNGESAVRKKLGTGRRVLGPNRGFFAPHQFGTLSLVRSAQAHELF